MRTRQGDVAGAAPVGVLDRKRQFGLLVGARHRPPLPAAAPPEQAAEQIFEVQVFVGEPRGDPDLPVSAVRRRPAGTPGPGLGVGRPRPALGIDIGGNLAEIGAEGVVAPTRLGIGKDVVRLGDVLEASLCGRVFVDVGVVGPGQLAVGPLYLLGCGRPIHAQGLVEVGRRHQSGSAGAGPLETTTPAGRRMFWALP